MKASERVLLGFGLPWVAYLIGWGTDAGVTVPVLLVMVWGGAALLLLWLVRLALHLRGTRRNPGERRFGRVLIEPLILLCCAGLVWTGAGFRLRFIVSRPALSRFVRDARPVISRGELADGTLVGLFRVKEAEVLPGGIVRLITTTCMFDHCGVAFSPVGDPPPVIGEDTYSPLGGGWWHWWRSW